MAERASLPPVTGVATTNATRAAVADEQRAHARNSLWAALGTAVVAATVLQLSVKKHSVHWILTASLVALALACAAVLFEGRRGHPYAYPRLLITGLLTVTVTLAATAHLGVLTPTVSFLLVTVYFNANGDSLWEAKGVYLLTAIGYLALIVLALTDVLPVTGSVLGLAKDNKRAIVGFGVVIETLLAVTYTMGVRAREATLTAIDRLARAQRQIEQRDALLFEARADLEGARGRLGRFSGRTVGHYLAHDLLGRGGSGEVYEALDEESGERVALKVMHPNLLSDEVQVARFTRQATLLRDLRSPHLIRVIEGGTTDDACPYLAMELLEGEDLAAILRTRQTLPLDEVVELTQSLARGLDLAQERGIVHRDLKPQNVFLARSAGVRTWKILDFGIAAIAEAMGELTRGAAIGTPGYMSPEQTRGESVDHRSDVFSLGTIVYRALTGQPAFAAPDVVGSIYRVNHVQPMRPSLLVKVPKDVDLVLALALAKDPGKRFRSASTCAAALRDAARGELDEPYRVAAAGLIERHGWGRDDAVG